MHTPKTKDTANLINTATIAQMKDGVRIINCARGGIVNEQDLFEALKSGKVGAAAFDVFEKEPPENHPLLTLDNFIATPHLGASTQEAQENVATAVAEQVVDYLVARHRPQRGQRPLRPRRPAADALAVHHPGRADGPLPGATAATADSPRCSWSTAARSPSHGARPDHARGRSRGCSTPILEENVNYVNAPLIAKDRGIEVKVSTSAAPPSTRT